MGESEQRALFESMGVQEVGRLVGAHRFNTINERWAITWLAERDQQETQRKKCSQAESLEIARPPNGAAWEAACEARKANKIAAAAFVVATIAIIVSIISIVRSN